MIGNRPGDNYIIVMDQAIAELESEVVAAIKLLGMLAGVEQDPMRASAAALTTTTLGGYIRTYYEQTLNLTDDQARQRFEALDDALTERLATHSERFESEREALAAMHEYNAQRDQMKDVPTTDSAC